MDPGYRKRKPGPLLDEVEMLYKDYGINYVTFQDDLLMSSVKHTEDVCLEFLKEIYLSNGLVMGDLIIAVRSYYNS